MTHRKIIFTGLLSAIAAAALIGQPAAPRAQGYAPVVSPVERGRLIADQECSSCHAIGLTGDSPFEGAPRWRDLHRRFDVADLAEAFAEGIMVGHEAMPSRAFPPDDVEGLIAYLKSLEPKPAQ
ncbi:MAG: cytochrome c [Caulobacter sp.]|nr:cytochrome c [Caulobacter sp.]